MQKKKAKQILFRHRTPTARAPRLDNAGVFRTQTDSIAARQRERLN